MTTPATSDDMERRGVSEIIRQLQPLLRKYERDDKLVLLDAEEKLGTKAGDNYMSLVYRIKITGKRKDGSPYKKSFMRKKMLENTMLAEVARNSNVFLVESHMYKRVLPLLGKKYGPDCILAESNEIIMEDLGSSNFVVCERRNLLDFDHCKAVIAVLASLHASTLSLKLKSPEKFAELVKPLPVNVFANDQEGSIGNFFENGVVFALNSLKSIETNDLKSVRATEFLRGYTDNVVKTMIEMLEAPTKDRRHWVIIHGDAWNNNVMFKHNAQGKVQDVKLVDFQVARHSSPAIDFTYFLYSSAKSEVLETKTEDLLKIYENSFAAELTKRDAPKRDVEALTVPGWFKDELRRYGLFGFFGSLMVVHAIFMDEGVATKILNQPQVKMRIKHHEFKGTPEKTERILLIVDHFIRNFRDYI